MRRYLIPIVIALGVHTIATFAVRPYGSLMVGLGGLFVHNTDVASIADRLEAGFVLIGAVLVLAVIAITYLARLEEWTTLVGGIAAWKGNSRQRVRKTNNDQRKDE